VRGVSETVARRTGDCGHDEWDQIDVRESTSAVWTRPTKEKRTYLGVATSDNLGVSRGQGRVPKFKQCPHLLLSWGSIGFRRGVKLTRLASSSGCRAEQRERCRARHVSGLVGDGAVYGSTQAMNSRGLGLGSKAVRLGGEGESDGDGGKSHLVERVFCGEDLEQWKFMTNC
jgi:hypothetical protein